MYAAATVYIRILDGVVHVLSDAVIVETGVRLARRSGVDAVGIRPVALQLGVTPMALYRHIESVDELNRRIVASLYSAIPQAASAGDPRVRCRTWAIEARSSLVQVPGLAHHLLVHWFEYDDSVAIIESLLAVCRDHGLDGFECVAAANAIFMFVLMRVAAEGAVRTAGVVHRGIEPVRRQPARFPLMRRFYKEFSTARFDAHFEFGLDALLDGLF